MIRVLKFQHYHITNQWKITMRRCIKTSTTLYQICSIQEKKLDIFFWMICIWKILKKKLVHDLLYDIFVCYFGMKILFTFLSEKKNLFRINKKFVYLIFKNKLSWYHPKITYENIVQKVMNKFFVEMKVFHYLTFLPISFFS